MAARTYRVSLSNSESNQSEEIDTTLLLLLTAASRTHHERWRDPPSGNRALAREDDEPDQRMTGADALYHRLFSHPLMVEQLLREFATEVVAAGLDFDRMEQVTAKLHAGTGERREGDVVWRLPTTSGTDLYLYVMIEFQSRSDWWMAVRTQVYQGLLWQMLIDEKKVQASGRLPPLMMIVL